MTGADDEQEARRLRKVSFPWPSCVFGLLAVTFLLITTEPWLVNFYQVPAPLLDDPIKYAVLATLALLVLLDVRRHGRQQRRQQRELQQWRDQVDELWQRNKQLQLKAHTYSENADKLKLFISDKLLEYIEYDEKFLHFKGIAAEVRHNGVISFDKVQTALREVAARADLEAPADVDAEKPSDAREALDALHYLWDLLDLSTAENLTLHIGNLLCECEEQYCQRLLDTRQAQALPYEPAYQPQRAVWRALAMVRTDTLPEPDAESVYRLDDGQLHVRLEQTGALLGKENHLVLLLENLLRNAQFYAAKRGYSSAFAPIALTLREEQGDACVRVYNRGPHIREEDQRNLFQLGYSTRRRREHHGRGLGLYFVNEIAKGYEGRVTATNIHTAGQRYRIHVQLQDGEERVESVEVVIEQGKPRCISDDAGPAASAGWTYPSPVQRVVVDPDDGSAGSELSDFGPKGRQDFHDPEHPERPHWRLRYRPKRNAQRLEFEALNINGVEFEVRLPTARKRLDSAGVEFDGEPDDEHRERRSGQPPLQADDPGDESPPVTDRMHSSGR